MCFVHKKGWGTPLAVQWLRLHASTAGGTGLIPGQGTKIPHATRCGKKKKKWGWTQGTPLGCQYWEVAHVYLVPGSREPPAPIPAPPWSRSFSTPSPRCTTCCSTRRVPRWRCAWQTGCRRWCPCSTRTTPSSWPSPPTACSSWPTATRRARWAAPRPQPRPAAPMASPSVQRQLQATAFLPFLG